MKISRIAGALVVLLVAGEAHARPIFRRTHDDFGGFHYTDLTPVPEFQEIDVFGPFHDPTGLSEVLPIEDFGSVAPEVGAAGGEPRRDPGATADPRAKKGSSTWFPDATLNQYDSQRSTG